MNRVSHESSSANIATLADALGPLVRHPAALSKLHGYLGRTEVYLVNGGEAILKVYLQDAAIKSGRERWAYELLRASNVPIPRVLGYGEIGGRRPWLLLSHVDGTLLDDRKGELDPADASLWDEIGRSLAFLHLAGLDASDPDGCAAADSDYNGFRQRVIEEGLPAASWQAASEKLLALGSSLPPGRRSLVHRDYCARNLIVARVGRSWELRAVIDFERASLDDPARDFALTLFKDLRGSANHARAFLAGYAHAWALPDRFEERVTYHLLGLFFETACWARAKDPAYFRRVTEALDTTMRGELRYP